MPVVPSIGECTVCELNRDFLTSSGDADTEAIETYSKLLGRRYPNIPYHPQESIIQDSATIEPETGRYVNGSSASREIFSRFKQLPLFRQIAARFKRNVDLDIVKKVELFQGLAWHKRKQCLAFITGSHNVCMYDFEEADAKEPVILSNESQRDVAAVAWRPNAGMMISVACRNGICIWAASYPGNIAPVRSGIASFLGAPSGSTGARWVLVDFLESPNHHPVTTITWSPSGRLLASASWYDSGFTIWDIAQGVGTPIRRGFGGISLIQWSPNGDYLLTAFMDGMFRLWETDGWTSEKWSSIGGPVVSVAWGSDDSVLLMALNQGTTLGALHFAGKPPSLDTQLLPVDLPDIEIITGLHGCIGKMAWDSSCERLAISFIGGDEIHSGLIAVYDTRKVPILAVTLMGFIRGPGSGAKALTFAFYESLEQGVLLSVCWSTGLCCTYPLIFKSGLKKNIVYR